MTQGEGEGLVLYLPRATAPGEGRAPGSLAYAPLDCGVRGRRVRLGAVGPHPHVLLALELLALGLQRRGDHELRAVELRDVPVAAGRHRGAQPAHEVERAVVLVRWADEDLLQRSVLNGGHARAARQGGM